MAKAIAPDVMPEVPEGAQGWRRSRRRGSVFHAHNLGTPICGANLYLDRNESAEAASLAIVQYWGVCPRCYRKSLAF